MDKLRKDFVQLEDGSAVQTRYRDPVTKQYAYDGDMERLCVCGHPLGCHIAGGFECGIDPVGWPQYADLRGCSCQKFRPSRAKHKLYCVKTIHGEVQESSFENLCKWFRENRNDPFQTHYPVEWIRERMFLRPAAAQQANKEGS